MNNEVARQLAEKLIKIYNQHKLPKYAELNRKYPEGFKPERINSNPEDSLFQLVIIAAYDRQPFTYGARGWEPIWGLSNSKQSLPAILRSVRLFDIKDVAALQENDIQERLSQCYFFGYRLNTDGAYTRYCKTFKDATRLIQRDGLLSLIKSASTAHEVQNVHKHLDSIHGIGPTIASKLVMYVFREIPFGNINPQELHSSVKPILKEYHNANLAKELMKCYGPDIIDQIYEELKKLGDPFAIDALYYVDRDEPKLKNCLLSISTIETNSVGKAKITNKQHSDMKDIKVEACSSGLDMLFEQLKSEIESQLGHEIYVRSEQDKRGWKLYRKPYKSNFGYVDRYARKDKLFPHLRLPHLRIAVKKEWADNANTTPECTSPHGWWGEEEAYWCVWQNDEHLKEVAKFITKIY